MDSARQASGYCARGRIKLKMPGSSVSGEAELVRLFSRDCVDAWASAEVRPLSEQIMTTLDETDLVDAKKSLHSDWIPLRFTSGSGLDCDDSRARVSRLLNAISGLTDKL